MGFGVVPQLGRCSASQRRRGYGGYGEIVLYGDNDAVFENIFHFTRTLLTTHGMAMCQTILSVSNTYPTTYYFMSYFATLGSKKKG